MADFVCWRSSGIFDLDFDHNGTGFVGAFSNPSKKVARQLNERPVTTHRAADMISGLISASAAGLRCSDTS